LAIYTEPKIDTISIEQVDIMPNPEDGKPGAEDGLGSVGVARTLEKVARAVREASPAREEMAYRTVGRAVVTKGYRNSSLHVLARTRRGAIR
jgi:hypothetical protein